MQSGKNSYDNIEAKYYHEPMTTPQLFPLVNCNPALLLLHVIESIRDDLAYHLGSSSLVTTHKYRNNK